MALAGQLTAVSPLDGRYKPQVASLTESFSEYALIKNRIIVEVEYLLFLARQKIGLTFSATEVKMLKALIADFDVAEAEKVKDIEAKIFHDVKAVEYYLAEKLKTKKMKGSEWLHFGLTSEDTNSLAIGLGLRTAIDEVMLPSIKNLILQLAEMSKKNRDVAMLARTHGQAALPTTLGKELLVFGLRLAKQYRRLASLRVEAKLTGAVGNFNAHHLAFPKSNWVKLSREFVTHLGLQPNVYTTQIVPVESYLEIFQTMQLINGVVLDLNQDVWRYISDGWLLQSLTKGQVGSSTMPQKINPIDFENSEGNLGLANTLFEFFIRKLPVSRLQRDLSDSVVKRNFGVAFGHSQLAYLSCLKGLKKITPNQPLMSRELETHWEIISEGIQTVLRTTGDDQAYDKLKVVTQGKAITQKNLAAFITGLDLTPDTQRQLLQLTPLTYNGLSTSLVDQGLLEIHHLLSERA
jgi:adenylosuccinate lyase